MSAASLSSPRLRQLARRPAVGQDEGDGDDRERCELCGAPIEPQHRHVIDLDRRALLCACRPCSLLFDRPAAAQGRLRRVPDRARALDDFVLDPAVWAALDIPVDIAWFVVAEWPGGAESPGGDFAESPRGDSAASSPGGRSPNRVRAFYPSPLGATESQLKLSAWGELQAANPSLADMAPEVEALLINRTERHPGQWLVPISDCYRLVAVMRRSWRGFSGGSAVWADLDDFFDELDRSAQGQLTHT